MKSQIAFGQKAFFVTLIALVVWGANLPASAKDNPPASSIDITPSLDACNVSWDVPGPTSSQSMPIGNGDIGLNVWVQPHGGLAFYIGKTSSWIPQYAGTQ